MTSPAGSPHRGRVSRADCFCCQRLPRRGGRWRDEMFQWRRPASALSALFATTVLLAGCNHLSPKADAEDADEEDPVEVVELDPTVTKVDEAAIGVSGPEQIEEAIEARNM